MKTPLLSRSQNKTVKRVLLGLAIACITGISASAQNAIGLRAGANLSSTSFSTQGGFKAEQVTGLQAGVMFDIPFSPILGLQVEGLFDQRGVVYKNDGFDSKIKLSLNYVTIPLALNVKVPITNSFSITGHAGGYASMGISGQRETTDATGTTKDDVVFTNTWSKADDAKAQVSLVDFGAMAGLGLRYKLAPGIGIFADGRYGLGFAELTKYDKDTQAANDLQKSFRQATLRNVNVSVGVMFFVGTGQ